MGGRSMKIRGATSDVLLREKVGFIENTADDDDVFALSASRIRPFHFFTKSRCTGRLRWVSARIGAGAATRARARLLKL